MLQSNCCVYGFRICSHPSSKGCWENIAYLMDVSVFLYIHTFTASLVKHALFPETSTICETFTSTSKAITSFIFAGRPAATTYSVLIELVEILQRYFIQKVACPRLNPCARLYHGLFLLTQLKFIVDIMSKNQLQV